MLLRAWPEVRRRTGATLRVIGADPRAVRLLMSRQRLSDEGVELLGVMVGDPLTPGARAQAKLLCAPSLGGESFGMVLRGPSAARRRSSPPTSPATTR